VPSASQEGFLVATIGDAQRLLELARVREIVPAMQLARPSGVAGACRGIANVRGDAIPVFDLAGRDGALSPTQLIVVAVTDQGTFIGIVVDDVLEVVELPAERVVAHPAGHGRYVRSVRWSGSILSVLTPREVVDAS
jgi:chemotaxis signal transduction protein